jgi:hypothetical protein
MSGAVVAMPDCTFHSLLQNVTAVLKLSKELFSSTVETLSDLRIHPERISIFFSTNMKIVYLILVNLFLGFYFHITLNGY